MMVGLNLLPKKFKEVKSYTAIFPAFPDSSYCVIKGDGRRVLGEYVFTPKCLSEFIFSYLVSQFNILTNRISTE